MTTLPKERSTFDFVYKTFNSFFLSLKHPHALTFFFTFFESIFSLQKNFRKKEQPKFLYETL